MIKYFMSLLLNCVRIADKFCCRAEIFYLVIFFDIKISVKNFCNCLIRQNVPIIWGAQLHDITLRANVVYCRSGGEPLSSLGQIEPALDLTPTFCDVRINDCAAALHMWLKSRPKKDFLHFLKQRKQLKMLLLKGSRYGNKSIKAYVQRQTN